MHRLELVRWAGQAYKGKVPTRPSSSFFGIWAVGKYKASFPSNERVLEIARATLPERANMEIIDWRESHQAIIIRMTVGISKSERKPFLDSLAIETSFE